MATMEKNGHNGTSKDGGTATLTRPETEVTDKQQNGLSNDTANGGTLAMAKSQPSQLQRRDTGWTDPFAMMQRMSEEMDALFDSFGFGQGSLFGRSPLARRNPLAGRLSSSPSLFNSSAPQLWSPQVEFDERDGNLIVRADLPGLGKDDVHIELENDTLTLHGERKDQREEKREGYYHSERHYGSFRRSIPLPAGIDPDSVKANFRNGVLEVTMPAPKPVEKARKIEVTE